ncbi:hypothetical protein EVAR_10449_1 [Eumeta japonica]|uniref:Uncharacterized protein n=1 Tax=Eumeta variegata TaxID=151549 RepID=A0A4C1TI66_EUMVA|nr:hypothetical protein EVAR_10449_1 [Eumeta japonica]
MQPDYGETVHGMRVQFLNTLEPDFGLVREAASLILVFRGSSLKRISAEWRVTVRLAWHAVRATLRCTASSIVQTPSFLFASAQAHETYNTISSITEIYMVLTISIFRPHVTLATRAKPLYMLIALLQALATWRMNVNFLSIVRPRRRYSPTRLICSPSMCTTGSSYLSFLLSTIEFVLDLSF